MQLGVGEEQDSRGKGGRTLIDRVNGMPYGLYLSAEGAQVQSKRLEVLANNLANVDTPGFKRDVAVFQARLAEATQRGLDVPGSKSENDLGGGVSLDATLTDFAPGPLRQTGIATDIAIDGDAFFVVRKGNTDHLTRAGNFMINPAGQLVTQTGDPVLGEDGGPLLISPEAGPWTITPDGAIAQAGDVTRLALVRPASPGDLVKVGENAYRPLAPPHALEPGERRVLPGYLEASGVKPTLEMMELIEASRAYESNINMIRNHDQMMGTLISRVLKEA